MLGLTVLMMATIASGGDKAVLLAIKAELSDGGSPGALASWNGTVGTCQETYIRTGQLSSHHAHEMQLSTSSIWFQPT
jgi:hypothetical protein